MKVIKLKDGINISRLTDHGFSEDPANCEVGDTYYHLNNYFAEIGDFRVTVSTISGHVDILCLTKESGLHNMFDLSPIANLFSSGLVVVEEVAA
ncbi:hypothetical protein BP422_15465 [Brevibacillus formosus]|uniref:Uncharacterized protein n=1 Tax=Brevibacillus formosus TaxID=54913 RepID=A0A220MJU4_9BACL|nr:hypothetical protein [Brevibacillus formosus]ASJ54840.1 hypothetical protein BP422_15465 [Brevibacillus formosus]